MNADKYLVEKQEIRIWNSCDLDGVKIQEPRLTPFNQMKLSIRLRGELYEIIRGQNS